MRGRTNDHPVLTFTRAWWQRQLDGLDLGSRITQDDTVPGFTVFVIGHQMPDVTKEPNRWQITTSRQIWKTDLFSADDRAAVKAAFKQRQRPRDLCS